MKKRNLLLVIPAILLVFGMVMSCGPVEEEELIDVTFVSAVANGSASATTTSLTLTFDQQITGLLASDISLSGATVTKGSLTGGSGGVYNLGISGVKADGTLSVSVTKKGYKITGSPKTADIKISDADKLKIAIDTATTYFGEYGTTYKLGAAQTETNEFITIEKTASNFVLTIEEKQNNTTRDKLVFTINNDGWEIVDVPSDVVDPSERGNFTIGFKIKGKITSVSGANEYIGSSKTSPGFVAADVTNGTPCWMFIWVGTYQYGNILVRSPFSKATTGTGFNENTHFVTGSGNPGVIRVYRMALDD